MIKYLILFISGRLYFTSFDSKTGELQEFEKEETDDGDISSLLAEFCNRLTSNFEIYLYTDTLTLHTVDLSKQAPAANPSLVEQFLLFELENVVDILPENPVLKFLKGKENTYHCLLTEESVVNDLKNICLQFGGKLAQLGHPAGFVSALNKNNCIEVFESNVHCQTLNDKASFTFNSSLPTEYDSVQKWTVNRSLRNLSIFNLAGKDVIPLEGNIIEFDFRSLKPQVLVKSLKSKVKNSPIFVFNKSNKNLKKQLPLIASLSFSMLVVGILMFRNLSINSQLESDIEKIKVSQKNLQIQKRELQKKISEVPELEKKLSKLKANEIIFQNVKFWPGLLENLGNSFDEYSQLTKVSSESDDSVTIQGITLNVLKMQKLLKELESDRELKISVLEKHIVKNRINENDIWNFTIKLARNQ